VASMTQVDEDTGVGDDDRSSASWIHG